MPLLGSCSKPHSLHEIVEVLKAVEVDQEAALASASTQGDLNSGPQMLGELPLETLDLGWRLRG